VSLGVCLMPKFRNLHHHARCMCLKLKNNVQCCLASRQIGKVRKCHVSSRQNEDARDPSKIRIQRRPDGHNALNVLSVRHNSLVKAGNINTFMTHDLEIRTLIFRLTYRLFYLPYVLISTQIIEAKWTTN
jgi:hypothetical protein